MPSLSLTNIKAIQPETAITVQINGAGTSMIFPANVPISFGDAASITISQASTKVALMKNTVGMGGEVIQVFRVDEIITVS